MDKYIISLDDVINWIIVSNSSLSPLTKLNILVPLQWSPRGWRVLPDLLMSVLVMWPAVASSVHECDESRAFKCASVVWLDLLHFCHPPWKDRSNPGSHWSQNEERYRADLDQATAWNQAKLTQQSPAEPQPKCRPGGEENSFCCKQRFGGMYVMQAYSSHLWQIHMERLNYFLQLFPSSFRQLFPINLLTVDHDFFKDRNCALFIPVSLDIYTMPGTEFKNSKTPSLTTQQLISNPSCSLLTPDH